MIKLRAFAIDGYWWLCYPQSDGKWLPFYRVGRVGDCIRF